MTFKKIIEFCNPTAVSGTAPDTLGKLRQDSRAVESGDIFIAVKGYRSDGHDFIGQAVENGASLIITEQNVELKSDIAVLQVKNTRKLLGPLSQVMAGYPAQKLNVIGISGTNGKTTVATLIWQILTKMEKNASMFGTVEKRINKQLLESMLTTADPIELADDMKRAVESGSEYLVMEVSSHALHQHRVDGIPFDVAVFTNLSHDHLDYHSTMDEYASSKKILFNSLDSSSSAITNLDDSRGEWIVNSTPAKVMSFSFEKKGIINASLLKSNAKGLKILVDDVEVNTPLVGKFNAYNVVESLLACICLGLDGKKVAETLSSCKGAPGRLERVNSPDEMDEEPIILVDYAHTPNALENVLTTLKEIKRKNQKLTVVFGCGGDRDRSKRPEMAAIAESHADKIYVTSDNPRTEDPGAIIDEILEGFSSRENVTAITPRREAIFKAILESKRKEIVLIAGKGHETYQEINGKRIHFDDREIAREALNKRNGKPDNKEVA